MYIDVDDCTCEWTAFQNQRWLSVCIFMVKIVVAGSLERVTEKIKIMTSTNFKTILPIYKESTDLLFKLLERYASRDPISLMQLLIHFIEIARIIPPNFGN